MSGEEGFTLSPSGRRLSDSEKEQVKLTSSYLNGIAVGLVLVGGLSLPTTIVLNFRSWTDILLAMTLSLFSLGFSPYLHRVAKRFLRRLDA